MTAAKPFALVIAEEKFVVNRDVQKLQIIRQNNVFRYQIQPIRAVRLFCATSL